jgi:DNA modification methylase
MNYTIIEGDCIEKLKELPEKSINTCVTSPPYYALRNYQMDGQVGVEESPDDYVQKIVQVFREVRRVLKDDGTIWINLGDSYAGSGGAGNQFDQIENGLSPYKQTGSPKDIGLKPKDLIGIPWRVAFALQADGWYLRSDIIWHKPNPMPESVKDRPTKSHEYIFLMSKNRTYYYDQESIKTPVKQENMKGTTTHKRSTKDWGDGTGVKTHNGFDKSYDMANKRDVWTVPTDKFEGQHFATFPKELIKPCILAGCPEGGTVLDPFNGSGTTCIVSLQNNRKYIGIELNPEYCIIAHKRISTEVSPLISIME